MHRTPPRTLAALNLPAAHMMRAIAAYRAIGDNPRECLCHGSVRSAIPAGACGRCLQVDVCV